MVDGARRLRGRAPGVNGCARLADVVVCRAKRRAPLIDEVYLVEDPRADQPRALHERPLQRRAPSRPARALLGGELLGRDVDDAEGGVVDDGVREAAWSERRWRVERRLRLRRLLGAALRADGEQRATVHAMARVPCRPAVRLVRSVCSWMRSTSGCTTTVSVSAAAYAAAWYAADLPAPVAAHSSGGTRCALESPAPQGHAPLNHHSPSPAGGADSGAAVNGSTP